MTVAAAISSDTAVPTQRARGELRLRAERRGGATRIADLRHAGALRAVFPGASGGPLQAVTVNTSGGVTGGDRFDCTAEAGPGAELVLTTQTAERAYKALPGQTGRISTRLTVGAGGLMAWVPQETILFDQANLRRRLAVELHGDARFLMVEPVILGRRAMGETIDFVTFSDRVRIARDGLPIWRDGLDLAGNAEALFERPAVGGGARAYATIAYVGPDAEAKAGLPGATLLPGGCLVIRLLAAGGFELRRAMLPLLETLMTGPLPTCWRL